jgi:hypothetical protein
MEQQIIMCILAVISLRNIGDWVIYNCKSGVKQSMVSKVGHLLGFASLAALLYLSGIFNI